jgi:electron transfer flavoprotein beta subunit
MRIAVAFKAVPDDQDITVLDSGELNYSKAHVTVSTYDLNAIEAAVQLKESQSDATLVAISVGPVDIDESKLKKNVLARGADELFLLVDDAYGGAYAYSTAQALKLIIEKTGPYDLIVFGDGSADNYAQQVNVQLAEAMGLPALNAVSSLSIQGTGIRAKRVLGDVIEVVELPLPAVVAVSSTIALPRICSMKDILAAGKKPATVFSAADLGNTPEDSIEIIEIKAPKAAERRLLIFESDDSGINSFASALAEALR